MFITGKLVIAVYSTRTAMTYTAMAGQHTPVAIRSLMYREERKWLLCAALAIWATVAGCTAEEGMGTAQVVGTFPQGLGASDVVQVELTVSGPGMATRTDALVKTGGQWGGVLGQLPAGTGRTFNAQAFDASNVLLYTGQVTGVTITAGQTASVMLLLQQVNAPAPFENAAPVITSLVASPGTVAPGGTVTLQAAASDANAGDTLTYEWTAAAGTFVSASSLSTTWTAPGQSGTVVLTLKVTDSKGATATLGFSITVSTGTGSAAVNVSVNTSPQVSRVTATPSAVEVGESTTVVASASDNDGDPLSYQWVAGCAGTWANASSASASFTPTAQPPASSPCASCPLTVKVMDGRGGQTTGTLSVCVGPKTTARFPPEVVESFQSTSNVPSNGSVTLRVRARDPQGSALSFAWAANLGTLGTATSGATTSEVLWTSPSCVTSGGSASITATVKNALNLAVATQFSVGGLPVCARWASAGSMAMYTYYHRATLLNSGKVLVTGGAGRSGEGMHAGAEVYDPGTGAWTSTNSMSTGRSSHTATLLPSGKVLVAGGYNGGSLATAEIYDPGTGSWTSTSSMATARDTHTATLLPSGKVLVTGGSNSSGPVATVEVYDPQTGIWSSTGSLATGRYEHTATLLPSGKVLVTGGYNATPLATAEVYNPQTGTWSSTGSLTTSRYQHTVALLSSGKVLVMGGYNGAALASVEVYDPGTGAWTATGSLVMGRHAHAATLLNSGKVLVMAGYNRGPLATAEVYDPVAGTWISTDSLAMSRSRHTATLLNSGKVLVTGGSNNSGVLATTEVYAP